MESWGDRVRRYRRLRRRPDGTPWTQEDLAEASGIDRRYIGRIETGEVENPNAETVAKLAKALHRSMRDIAEPLHWYDQDPLPPIDEFFARLRGLPLSDRAKENLEGVAREMLERTGKEE